MTALHRPGTPGLGTAAPENASETPVWWRRAVVYQVYPRSFADSDGDGVGDLRGIIQRLDHLEALGVDVLWISPVYASPHADNGYDISDYRAIDPLFGTLEDLDELIAQLHRRGMRLVLDMVLNHTSDEHPWFIESASGPDSPKRDWYWWRPPRAGMRAGEAGAEPTNWEGFFSGPVWTLDPASGEYYLHLFAAKQPDLNWENPEVRAALHEMLRWWLARGVDGFRFDVINLISKDPALPDGPVRPGHRLGDGGAHYIGGPRMHEFLAELRREVLDRHPEALLTVGEMPGVTIEDARLATDPARGELDMVFQFDHVALDHGPEGKWGQIPVPLQRIKRTFADWQEGLADAGWNSLYWENHDQPRVVSRFGDDGKWWRESATALAAVLHLQRGTPYVYQGEELGMTNPPFRRIEDFRDIETLNFYAEAIGEGADAASTLEQIRGIARDNARTPMQWDSSEHAGFTTGTPWIAVNPNTSWLNAQAQRGSPGSVFEFYRSLIRLRHEDPLVVEGRFRLLLPEHPAIFAYLREGDGEALLLLANCGGKEAPLPDEGLPPWLATAHTVLGNWDGPGEPRLLRPWEARVLRSTELSPRPPAPPRG